MAPQNPYSIYDESELNKLMLSGALDDEEPSYVLDPSSPEITAPGVGSSMYDRQQGELLEGIRENINNTSSYSDDSGLGELLSSNSLLPATDLSREQKTAGVLIGILPLLAGLLKGKKGIKTGGQIGALASQGYFGDLEKKQEKEAELRKLLLQAGVKNKFRQEEKAEDRIYNEKILDKKLTSSEELADKRASDLNQRIENSTSRSQEETDIKKADSLRSDLSLAGRLDVIEGVMPSKDAAKAAGNFDRYYQRADKAFNRLIVAIKSGDISEQREAKADLVLAKKDAEGAGASFTFLEEALVSAGLPALPDELTTDKVNKWFQAEGWRGENALERTVKSRDIAAERAQNEIASYGFYIPGQKYKKSVLGAYPAIPSIEGRTPTDMRGVYKLLEGSFRNPKARESYFDRSGLAEGYKAYKLFQDPEFQEYLSLKRKAGG